MWMSLLLLKQLCWYARSWRKASVLHEETDVAEPERDESESELALQH